MSKTEIINIELECNLTEKELLKYSVEMAKATNKIDQLEDSKKSYNDQIKSQISAADADLRVLCKKISSGKEYRQVECSVKYDWVEGKKRIYRNDTGEFVKDDIITEEERQEKLSLNK